MGTAKTWMGVAGRAFAGGATLVALLAVAWSQYHPTQPILDALVSTGLLKYSFVRRSLTQWPEYEFTGFCFLDWDNAVKMHADKNFLIFENQSFTYQQMDVHVHALAAELKGRFAVKPGDVVASALDLTPEGLAVLLACHVLGAIHAPQSPGMTASEVERTKEALGDVACVIVGTKGPAAATWEIRGENVFIIDLSDDSLQAASHRVTAHPWLFHETVALMPTSGSSGFPKFVMASWRSLVSFDGGRCGKRRLFMTGGWQEGPILWNIYWGISAPATYILTLDTSKKVCTAASARNWAGLINKHSIDRVQMYPTASLAFSEIDVVMPTVTSVSVFGRAPNPRACKQMQALFPNAQWMHGYGMTEFMGQAGAAQIWPSGKGPLPDRFFASVGKPYNSSLQTVKLISDEDNSEESGYRVGELRFRLTYHAFSGYWRNDEKTRRTFDEDGFIKTEDLAYFDKDRFIYIVGRKDDAIKHRVLGKQLFPNEVEHALIQHPEVSAVSVVAKLDQSGVGEHLVACVVPVGNVSVDSLVDHCKQAGLDNFKIPTAFHFVDSLPMGHMGWKVSRKQLKKIIAEVPWSSLMPTL